MNLNRNKIEEIPQTARFPKLRVLRIAQNPIKDLKTTLERLKRFNSLEVLEIDIAKEEDVMTVIKNLPNLVELNNNPVKEEGEELESDPRVSFADEDQKFQVTQ